jgi:DNA-binding Lrp family transcriptional regulator
MSMARDDFELRLLNDYQQRMPLVPEPYAAMARELGVSRERVLHTLEARCADGTISRIGAVIRPHAVGASTLAAIAVPQERLEHTVAVVNDCAEVNHNYLREHEVNLWFVVAAGTRGRVQEVLAGIARSSGLPVLDLPLERSYRINLGFDLAASVSPPAGDIDTPMSACALTASDVALLREMEAGLPLVTRPYSLVGPAAGMGEHEAIRRLRELCVRGVIRRLGVIVRHRALGYEANAMCVWRVEDEAIDAAGRALAACPGITLAYRRTPRPSWPYTLYAMAHGRDHAATRAHIDAVEDRCGLAGLPHAVLFSSRCFRQRGARYFSLAEAA